MLFSCSDSPRKRLILDSGLGGQRLGGGVVGGVNGALCMAEKWKFEMGRSCGETRTNPKQTNRKKSGLFSCEVRLREDWFASLVLPLRTVEGPFEVAWDQTGKDVCRKEKEKIRSRKSEREKRMSA
jgi:hypothetical protein